MKKLFTLIAVAMMSVVAFADSYTLTFKTNGEADATGVIKAETTVADVVATGEEYVAGFKIGPASTTTRAYLAKDGYGLKFGNSSNPGNFVIVLSAKGTVKANSIVVKAAAYGTDTPSATINDKAIAVAGNDFADYTVDLDGSVLDSIYVSGTAKGRIYIQSITVNYTADSFDATLCHSPRYSEGKIFECLAGPDMLDETKTKDGAVKKGLADRYQWIDYVNPTSTLDDGTAEVQTSNRWTNYNPAYADYNYGTGANWIQVTGENGSKNCPVLSSAWGKYMVFYVKDTKKVSILGIGSASGSATDGNRMVAVAKSAEGDVVEVASEAGKIYGKGTASDTLNITLDPAKSWQITVQGDADVKKDIQLGGIQLWGTSEVAGPAVHTATPTDLTYDEVVLGPDMVKQIVAAADGKTYSISAQPWIVYNNASSTLAEGTEVQTSNRWTNLDPMGQTAGWIQIVTNGSALSPVVSDMTGKTMTFNVKGTSKFTVFAAGSSSNKATSLDYIKVTAQPYNSNAAIEATSTPGMIYGKGTASDSVSIVLNPTESYAITVTTAPKADDGKNPDIMLTGINLWTVDGEAQAAAGTGTLNKIIADAIKAATDKDGNVEPEIYINLGAQSYTSVGNTAAYTLVGEACTGNKGVTINGNGATIKAAADGQITTKNYLVIDNVIIDATESTVAPIAMAPKASLTQEDTLSLYTYVDSTATYRYAGASQKVFEAQLLSLTNSTVKTAAPLISGNDAPWALRKLNIDNCQIEFTYNTKKDKYENICWYGGANSIQDITFTNSTFYCDSVTNNAYFLRYSNASNAQPQKVWGTDGTASWTMTSNTFVNIASNQNFANNFSSKNNVTLDFKKNVFANTWRLQKIASGAVRNFGVADNVICGGVNSVDATDKSKYATEESADILGIYVNASGKNFVPGQYSIALRDQMGDPRWLDNAPEYCNAVESLETLVAAAGDLLDAADRINTLPEYSALAVEMFNANIILSSDPVDYTKAVNEIPALSAAIDAYKAAVEVATGISSVTTESAVNEGSAYNLAGQRVNASSKGIVIKNGKKYINK